jgi:hypothetical protein
LDFVVPLLVSPPRLHPILTTRRLLGQTNFSKCSLHGQSLLMPLHVLCPDDRLSPRPAPIHKPYIMQPSDPHYGPLSKYFYSFQLPLKTRPTQEILVTCQFSLLECWQHYTRPTVYKSLLTTNSHLSLHKMLTYFPSLFCFHRLAAKECFRCWDSHEIAAKLYSMLRMETLSSSFVVFLLSYPLKGYGYLPSTLK